jgi:hypothetical protein
VKPARLVSIGLNDAYSSGRMVDQYTFLAQPKIQPIAIIVMTPATRVSVVERSERILIHSLRRTLAGVTGSTVTNPETADERAS